MAQESKPLDFDDEGPGNTPKKLESGFGLWPVALPNELMLVLNEIANRRKTTVAALISEGLGLVIAKYKET